MLKFINKKLIIQETLGEKLKKVRLAQDLSLKEIEKIVHIQESYLEALEEGDYHKLPGPLYTISFLKKYSRFLGFKWEELTPLYKEEVPFFKNLPPSTSGRKRFLSGIFDFLVNPKFLRLGMTSLVVLGILTYLALEMKVFISPPELLILEPIGNLVTHFPHLKVRGQTEKEALVMINDEPVLVNKDGFFTEEIDLTEGLNEIKIIATRTSDLRPDKMRVVVRKVMVIGK